MVEIIVSVSALAASGLVLWRANSTVRLAAQSAGQAETAAGKAERAAVSSRSHSTTALSHSKSAQVSADKASDSAVKSADQSNLFSVLMAKMDSSIPRQPRSRNEVHEQVTAENYAREDKQAVAEAQARSRRPTWLAPAKS
jgi:hypothetical protein